MKRARRLDIFTLKLMLNLTVRFLSMHSFDREEKESHEERCMSSDGRKRDWVNWTKIFFILFILFYKSYMVILLVGSKSLDAVIISDTTWRKYHKKLRFAESKCVIEYFFTLYCGHLPLRVHCCSEHQTEEGEGSRSGLADFLSNSHRHSPSDGCVIFRLLLTDLYTLAM